jgi:hypothetical protein
VRPGRAENPVPGRLELFAPESIRRSLNINDGDRITIELDDSGEMLQNMKQDWREQHRFFSNQGKEDRERWVVGASLPASWSTDWVTLSPCGWRSVSCLIKNEALMLFATDSAPAFLRGS